MINKRDALLMDLGQNLRLIGRRVWQQHGLTANCFSSAQDELLLALGGGKLTVKRLAEHLYITPGAVTQQVETLEKLGAVKRATSKTDRREVMVVLTRKGRGSLKTIKKAKLQLLGQAFGSLNGYELRALVELTAKATQVNQVNKAT